MRKLGLVSLFTLILFALIVSPALAQGDETGDRAVFGQDVIIGPGERHNGDLFVMGGDVTVRTGATVRGDVVTIGGDILVEGRIMGDLAAIGGDISLRDGALIDGDVFVTGGHLNRAPGARVRGQIVEGWQFGRLPTWRGDGSLEFGSAVNLRRNPILDFLLGFLRAVFTSVGLTILGILLVLFLPQHVRRVSHTALAAPLPSLGVGFLTLLTMAVVIPILMLLSTLLLVICIGLLGFPLIFALTVAVGATVVYGWIAMGLLVGQKILQALQVQEELPVVEVTIGVLLISLLANVPCLGSIVAFFVGCTGLGAVLLSRGGSRTYPPASITAGPPAVSPAPTATSEVTALPEVTVEEEKTSETSGDEPEAPLVT